MQLFNPFSQYVVSIFLILFGCNFTLYYLILIGKLKHVLKSEEVKSYFLIVAVSVFLVFISLVNKFESFPQQYTTEEAFRHSLFQVSSLMTTAGSTSGGIKLSRIILAVKGAYINVRKLINPHYVPKARFEGKTIESKTINDVFAFLVLYFFILLVAVFLLSFDPINGKVFTVVSDAGTYQVEHGFFSNFSASLASISNVGPAFEAVGPYASFADFSGFSKIVLSLTMLLGRLEILPVLILFNHKTWQKL